MGDIVSLRKARKAAVRREDEIRAAQNRLLHGRTKAERALISAQTAKSRRDLEAHRTDPGEKQ